MITNDPTKSRDVRRQKTKKVAPEELEAQRARVQLEQLLDDIRAHGLGSIAHSWKDQTLLALLKSSSRTFEEIRPELGITPTDRTPLRKRERMNRSITLPRNICWHCTAIDAAERRAYEEQTGRPLMRPAYRHHTCRETNCREYPITTTWDRLKLRMIPKDAETRAVAKLADLRGLIEEKRFDRSSGHRTHCGAKQRRAKYRHVRINPLVTDRVI